MRRRRRCRTPCRSRDRRPGMSSGRLLEQEAACRCRSRCPRTRRRTRTRRARRARRVRGSGSRPSCGPRATSTRDFCRACVTSSRLEVLAQHVVHRERHVLEPAAREHHDLGRRVRGDQPGDVAQRVERAGEAHQHDPGASHQVGGERERAEGAREADALGVRRERALAGERVLMHADAEGSRIRPRSTAAAAAARASARRSRRRSRRAATRAASARAAADSSRISRSAASTAGRSADPRRRASAGARRARSVTSIDPRSPWTAGHGTPSGPPSSAPRRAMPSSRMSSPNSNSVWSSHQPRVDSGSSCTTSVEHRGEIRHELAHLGQVLAASGRRLPPSIVSSCENPYMRLPSACSEWWMRSNERPPACMMRHDPVDVARHRRPEHRPRLHHARHPPVPQHHATRAEDARTHAPLPRVCRSRADLGRRCEAADLGLDLGEHRARRGRRGSRPCWAGGSRSTSPRRRGRRRADAS